jgi:osmotically-inducible protein OsmY
LNSDEEENEMERKDDRIQKDVVDHLYWDNRVVAARVKVEVENGEVTLTGTVPTYFAKQAALSDAWQVEGVKTVNNKLLVEYDIPVPTDSRLENNVRIVLKAYLYIEESHMHIYVKSGWVTLEGQVDALWKKTKVENSIADMVGVTGITNKLTVVPTHNEVDEIIARQVIDSIERNSTLNINSINIEVENGIVNLSGTVPNWHYKEAAFETALYTFGVLEVKNNLVIK